jgi:isopentenyl phosphate kinase
MKELILIKLGGSVITDKSKPFTARLDVIRRLAEEIKKNFFGKNSDLIIGHGGGSFPHVPAAKYQTQKGIINKNSVWGFCETADAAIQINRIIINEFLTVRMPVASFAPLSFIYQSKTIFEHIKKALEIRIVPVIYGDVIMSPKRGFEIYSGEKTLDLLARKLNKYYKRIKIIYYTDTNGVYDDRGKTIPEITPTNFKQIKEFIKGSGNIDVTGGMIHKVEESLSLVQELDAEVIIMNGLSRGKSTRILK